MVFKDVIECPLGAVLGDEGDGVQVGGHVHARPDEAVHVVVPQLPHQLHLLHHLSTNVFFALELKLFNSDNAAIVFCSLAKSSETPGLS